MAPDKVSAESQDINVTPLTDDYYINAAGNYTLSGGNAYNVTIYVAGNLTGEVNITLNGVNMVHDNNTNTTPLDIGSGTTVNMNLVGINHLSGSGTFPGICVPGGATLNIGGDGSLYAGHSTYADVYSAPGIGGNMGADTGNITINSGYVKALGGAYAASIGGSQGKSGGTIIINGGTVYATGVKNGAGIGGGYQATSSTVTINGGTVVASSIGAGAAIGNGKGGAENTVTINGGNVTTNSAHSGAGIGGSTGSTTASRVIINGGIVTAISVYDSDYMSYGAGIGNGYLGSGGIVEINGGIVTATGNIFTAGIGGGFQGNGCDLTIRGGTVSAIGRAGIGAGGEGTNAGSCIITGGSVKYSNLATGDLNPVICYDNNGTKAYMTTVHIPGISAATDVSYSVNGGALISSTTDTSGNLYLWLEEQSGVTGSVTVNGGNSYSFSGNIQANNLNVLTAMAVTTYTVTVGTFAGGSITASPASAVSGSSITLLITPDSGKQLKAGSLKYNDGTKDVAITNNVFILTDANVIITAEFENIPVPSTDTNLISIGTPTSITGLMNGASKSAAGLGLPATVAIITSNGSKSASVVWDVASCTYNQSSLSAQSFIVAGSLTLPSGVVNTNNISLSVAISVSVNQGTNPDSGTVGSNPTTNPNTNPILPSVEGSEAEGWDSITQHIANNNTGSITVNMNGETTVAQEVFEAIKGKDINLTFDLGNGMEWMINGTDIPESANASLLQGIDFNLSMNTDSIPAELLDALADTEKVQISLEYDGSFGFTAILRLPMEEKYSGKFANLFYYNPVTNQLELQAVGVVNENGTVEFPFTHASDYVIVMSTTAMLDDAIDKITVTPKKKTLYVGGTKGSSVSVKTVIPEVVQKAVSDGLCEMSITYKSSNPKVAAISGSGKITGKKTGTVTITTTIKVNGVEKSYQTTIKVKKAYIKLVKSTKTMKLGETFTFQAKGYGVEIDDITFTTSAKSIVIINKITGKAMAKSAGTDYVIAKAGNVEVRIKVVVQK
jgi:hypothetical protein